MATTAGDMIIAGDLGRAIKEYRAQGGGAAGWNAAADYLRQRHKDASTTSINAVINQAKQVVQVSGRYARAGPNYAIDPAAVPDVRYLERGGAGAIDPATGKPRSSSYIHQFVVTIRDPSNQNRIVSSYAVTSKQAAPLTRDEFERLARDNARQYVQQFINYDPTRIQKARFTYEISLEGVYRGF